MLSFQYISHRVLRWTAAPLSLPFILIINAVIAFLEGLDNFSNAYVLLFCAQLLFYILAMTGWYLENKAIKIKALFVPYYFFIMNYAVLLGMKRYFKGSQSVNWERAKRGQQ